MLGVGIVDVGGRNISLVLVTVIAVIASLYTLVSLSFYLLPKALLFAVSHTTPLPPSLLEAVATAWGNSSSKDKEQCGTIGKSVAREYMLIFLSTSHFIFHH